MAFATFDGHSGIEAASYAKENLYCNIYRNGLLSQSDAQVKAAISDAFRKTQEDMWGQIGKKINLISELFSVGQNFLL